MFFPVKDNEESAVAAASAISSGCDINRLLFSSKLFPISLIEGKKAEVDDINDVSDEEKEYWEIVGRYLR